MSRADDPEMPGLARRPSPAPHRASGRVFGVGFHKTGTTSLGAALRRLGHRVCGAVGVRDPRIAERALEIAQAELGRYDAFQDNPWPILFRELDGLCPGSRFILTERPAERWIASVVRHFGRTGTPMREWIYGVAHPEGNEAVYLARYEAHNRAVREYFRNRPGDLLVMDLEAGDGWEKLCAFLGRPVPRRPFPHRNRAEGRGPGSQPGSAGARTSSSPEPRGW